MAKKIEVPQMRGVQDLLTLDKIETQSPTMASCDRIKVNPNQPRRWFDLAKLEALEQSIKEHGILEPLIVRPLPDGYYELIAGERRLRAAIQVGLAEVPIVSKELTDQEALSISLIENLQREDLNPLEEVEAILALLSLKLDLPIEGVKSVLYEAANQKKRKLELTEDVSRQLEQIELILSQIGKFSAESFRTSRLPLLNLPNDLLEVLRQGQIEYTKARAIGKVKDVKARSELLHLAISEDLSLSEIKSAIEQLNSQDRAPKSLKDRYKQLSQELARSSVWKDPTQAKALQKLLTQIETLVAKASKDVEIEDNPRFKEN
jgi:ParB family chromosome partitioning protein